MRALLFLVALPLLAERLPNGLEVQLPKDWRTQPSGGEATLLVPPGVKIDPEKLDEVYAVTLLPGVKDPQDPILKQQLETQFLPPQVRPRTEPARPFPTRNGTGYLHSWSFTDPQTNEVGRLQIYIVGLRGGGAAALMSIGKLSLTKPHDLAMMSIATSLDNPTATGLKPDEAHPLAVEWRSRLNGKMLAQFSGSSQFGSGGMNSSRKLFLWNNGKFDFRSQSSVYISGQSADASSSGSTKASGTWRIYAQNGQAFLELKPSDGPLETLPLKSEDGKTFVNGQRMLVGDPQ
jgi:hypothetical protein